MLILLLTGLLAGATLVYLCHHHQGWLAKPLAVYWGWCGALLLLTTLLIGCALYPVNTVIFAWLVGLMLVWGLLPFVPLLIASLPFTSAQGRSADEH